MNKKATSCSRVSDDMFCPRCKEKNVVKNGKTKNNKQQYYCKICCHSFIENYTNQAYNSDINQNIIQLTKEGLGNGNPTGYTEEKSFRKMTWDEENRLSGINYNGRIQQFTYDAGENA